jgi:D-alanyl-D-alanine carboxypeptidase (penicillin-binding protein 5/6)
MDVETGQILLEKDAHKKVIPASIVKMMVLLLVMEKIDAGVLHLSDIVTVSAWASKIGGHQVYLAEGEQFSLEELLEAVAISSANDASTAVAEYLAGDVDACVEMMNARAKELGMNDTTFANVHGLPPDKGQKENLTSAYDVALLGRELLKYPQILTWTSTIEDTFRNGTFTLTNTNRQLIRKYRGADGLKTGFHGRGAGFSVCATAQRQDRRLIAVVMGAPRKVDRYSAVVDLLNLGFNQFERVVVLRKGFTVGEPVLLSRGKNRTTTLVASENAVVVLKKGQKKEIKQEIDIPVDRIIAPVDQGTRFGEAVISVGDQVIMRVDLVIEKDIEKGSIIDRLKWWIVDKIF